WAGFAAPTRGVCLKVNNFYDLRRFGRALTRAFLGGAFLGERQQATPYIKDKGERIKNVARVRGIPGKDKG
ncbi:MAG: hypothetical protein AABZ09_09790, partial [Candidatus Binatota bacterium]